MVKSGFIGFILRVFPPVFFVMILTLLTTPDNDAHAQSSSFTVTIARGAANPSFDPQIRDRPAEWYAPTKLTISVNDTVTWANQDIEKHTVTSGESSGRTGFVQGDLGKVNGIFDSGIFGTDEQWSYKFAVPGTYQYFCTLHPWMFGIVVVEGTDDDLPDYPVDVIGNRVSFPAMSQSSDGKYHTGLYWSPVVLRTGEQVTFTNDFFDSSGSTKIHLLKYDFALFQNGKEIHRSLGFSEGGSDIKYFVFSEPGAVTVRFENIGGDKNSFAEFGTIVYPGKSGVTADAIISSNKIDPAIIQSSIYAIPIGIAGGAGAFVLWFARHWRQ
jgi:plastocyanin